MSDSDTPRRQATLAPGNAKIKPTKEVDDKAMEWARRFLTRYSTIPRTDILTYARALRRKARNEEDPNEAAWCKARAEALQSLLEKR